MQETAFRFGARRAGDRLLPIRKVQPINLRGATVETRRARQSVAAQRGGWSRLWCCVCLAGGESEPSRRVAQRGVGWTLLQSLWALLRRVAGLGPSRERDLRSSWSRQAVGRRRAPAIYSHLL